MTLLRANDELHVWLVDLRKRTEATMQRIEVLSDAERLRAAKFISERDRQRFMVAHVALRDILSLYVGVSAQSIAFEFENLGKPRLSRVAGAPPHFNFSHSGDFALCAVTGAHEVGADIEQIQYDANVAGVVRQFFSNGERLSFEQVKSNDRARCFTRIWVHKEACLKASGLGIGGDLTSFSTTLGDHGKSVRTTDSQGTAWILQDVAAPSGYCAAVATTMPLSVTAMCLDDRDRVLSRAWAPTGV